MPFKAYWLVYFIASNRAYHNAFPRLSANATIELFSVSYVPRETLRGKPMPYWACVSLPLLRLICQAKCLHSGRDCQQRNIQRLLARG